MGDDLEKPKEPLSECRIRVIGGYGDIVGLLDSVKEEIYRYNVLASKKGYYLKPVHKVYKPKGKSGKAIYEYYGRYWWKKLRGRLIYSGTTKPRILPNPPENPLEGLSIVREGEDVILDCFVYERYRWIFKDKKVVREL
ncbi:MAG: hypothetical protein F7B11_01515 [Caldisphaeraceae archaeon]|nr:hypothetical protein [Caldisphaeraceae archaeon]MEB2793734.1 hypothetical protein [Caldisphaeraceae archaeon]MEB3691977.1 hypothetical protein [Caldisphaeraceae archaeon]MEB3798623.1 hypothetical protein [Caldisphaeraceae archaeon]